MTLDLVKDSNKLVKIKKLISQNPKSEFFSHPEREAPKLTKADFIGSTSALLNYTKRSSSQSFIIATESGIHN